MYRKSIGIVFAILYTTAVDSEFLTDDQITDGHVDNFLEVTTLKRWYYEDAEVLEVAIEYKSPSEKPTHWFIELGHREIPTESPYIVPIPDGDTVRFFSEYAADSRKGRATVKLGSTAIAKYNDYMLTAAMVTDDEGMLHTSRYHQTFDRISAIINSLKSNGNSLVTEGTLHIVRVPPAEVLPGNMKMNQLVVSIRDIDLSHITPQTVKGSLLFATQVATVGDSSVECERQALSDGFMSMNINSTSILKGLVLEARDWNGKATFRTSISKSYGFVGARAELKLLGGRKVFRVPSHLYKPVPSNPETWRTEDYQQKTQLELSSMTATSLVCLLSVPSNFRVLESQIKFQLILGNKPTNVRKPLVFRLMTEGGPGFAAMFAVDSTAMQLVNGGMYSCSVHHQSGALSIGMTPARTQVTLVSLPVVRAMINRQNNDDTTKQVTVQCSARSERPIQMYFLLVSADGQEHLLQQNQDQRVKELSMQEVHRGLDADLVLLLSQEQDFASKIQCRVTDQSDSVITKTLRV